MQPRPSDSLDSIREELEQQQICCEICNIATEQTKLIISQLLIELKPSSLEEEGQNSYDCGGLKKLLKLIFHGKCKNLRDTMKCCHTKAEIYFLQKLGINLNELNKISNKKIVSLAKYNFHGDVISLQVKNFNRHFSGTQKQNKKIKKKQESPKNTISTIGTDKINLQEKYQTSQNKQPNMDPIIKSQPEYNNHLLKHQEFLEYHHQGNAINPYTINDFSQMMLMINYGYHPMNQN